MGFREFQYVIAIAKYQNITKAAESLYIGQPTLSKFLKNLEDELGVSLFRKAGHKYHLTYVGERYLEKAEQILQLKSDLDAELADIVKRNVGVLRLGFPTMRCTYMLPAILPAFQEMYPNVKIQIVEGPSAELDKKLLNMEVDLAFYNQRFGDTNPLIQTKILGEEELLICVKKGHPMERFAQPNPASKCPRLDVRLLQNETILLMLKNQRTRQIIDQYLHQQGVVFENILHTSNIPAIMELISVGYGVSFLFEPHILQHNFKNPISCFSFGEPRTTSALVVATRKNSYLPSFANDYIELAKRLYINI